MGQERLSSLAILHIHKDKDIDMGHVINTFAGAANRRLALIERPVAVEQNQESTDSETDLQ